MRIFHILTDQFVELDELPATLPATGFLWIGSARREFEVHVATVQARLQAWNCGQLVDLHVSDLLSQQLPSNFDSTSWYDLLVFRRLAVGAGTEALMADDAQDTPASARLALESIDTSPIGFAVFDRVLLTVHPADLMLRMTNHMVDSYLALRRLLTRQLGTLQSDLLDSKSRFGDWKLLLGARNTLHMLEDTCEDQRSAMQEWIDSIDEWPSESDAGAQRERELLRLRSRDVLEHIERVLTHVRRLEHSAEVAVQMHFSALGHRTNDIMRTLTVLTAIFLPLNLITGFFGMNFDSLPLIHSATGIWAAVGVMATVGISLIVYFRRKRYLGSSLRK